MEADPGLSPESTVRIHRNDTLNILSIYGFETCMKVLMYYVLQLLYYSSYRCNVFALENPSKKIIHKSEYTNFFDMFMQSIIHTPPHKRSVSIDTIIFKSCSSLQIPSCEVKSGLMMLFSSLPVVSSSR